MFEKKDVYKSWQLEGMMMMMMMMMMMTTTIITMIIVMMMMVVVMVLMMMSADICSAIQYIHAENSMFNADKNNPSPFPSSPQSK